MLEITCLFSVRYRSTTSLTRRGVLGTPAVLVGTGTIVVLRVAFTCRPVLQARFATWSLGPVAMGLLILASGAVLLPEAEKHRRRRFAARRR